MATLKEERARLQFLEEHGHGEEKVHVVFVEREAKERAKNDGPKPKTRFQWETDFAGGYSELNEGKDRLMRVIGNKQVAISVAAKLWLRADESLLRELAEGN